MKLIHVSLLAVSLWCAAMTNAHADGWVLSSQTYNSTTNSAQNGTGPYSGTSKITATGPKVEAESKNVSTMTQSQTFATFEGTQSLNYTYEYTGTAPSTTPTKTVAAKGKVTATINVVNSSGFGLLAEAEAGNSTVKVAYPTDPTPKSPVETTTNSSIGGTSVLTATVTVNTKAKTTFSGQGTTGTCFAKAEVSGVIQ